METGETEGFHTIYKNTRIRETQLRCCDQSGRMEDVHMSRILHEYQPKEGETWNINECNRQTCFNTSRSHIFKKKIQVLNTFYSYILKILQIKS